MRLSATSAVTEIAWASPAAVPAAVALRSMPEQKTLPAWESTTTRTTSSSIAARSPAASSPISRGDRALRLAGESSVRVATPQAVEECTSSVTASG